MFKLVKLLRVIFKCFNYFRVTVKNVLTYRNVKKMGKIALNIQGKRHSLVCFFQRENVIEQHAFVERCGQQLCFPDKSTTRIIYFPNNFHHESVLSQLSTHY
jgi:hypothetical protein